MGAIISCPCSCEGDGQARVQKEDGTEIVAWPPFLAVDVDGDSELVKVLERLQAASELHQHGLHSRAVERLEEAHGLMDKLEHDRNCEIKRSQSLRTIRSVVSSDPTLIAIEAERKGTGSPLSAPDAEFPVEVEVSPSDADPVDMEGLEAKLERILVLCREARVFDAAASLQLLQDDIGTASIRCEQACKGDGPESGDAMAMLAKMKARLQTDPTLKALGAVYQRMRGLLSQMGPQALPGGPKDTRWVRTVLKDPVVGKDFSAEIHIRFMDTHERDKDGPSTQLILCGQLSRFPMDIAKFVSVYRETDLYKKEWIADAESCEGGISGPEQSYSSYSRIINASPILPVRLEVLTVREFAVCGDAPLSGRRRGVLVSDLSPPGNVKEFCGWALPQQPKRSVRVSGLGLILYFEPCETSPGSCNVFAFARTAVPVPQFLVPLSLVKAFLAHHFLSVFKAIKLHIADHWDELGYGDRIAACPDFYKPIEQLGKSAGS